MYGIEQGKLFPALRMMSLPPLSPDSKGMVEIKHNHTLQHFLHERYRASCSIGKLVQDPSLLSLYALPCDHSLVIQGYKLKRLCKEC